MNTVAELLAFVRKELSDPLFNSVDTYSFYKDEEIIEYISNAQQEFSRFTKCLPDYDSFSINIVSGTNIYDYDDQILEILGGKLSTAKLRVKADSFENIERRQILDAKNIERFGSWEAEIGTPRYIVTNMEMGKLRLWPTPISSDTLNLYVYKIADKLTADIDEFEIPEHQVYGLVFRVMSLAFNKLDTSQINESERSMLFGQKWQSFLQDAKQFHDLRFNRV